MKISLEQVEATLLEKKIEQETITSILKDLEQSINEDKEDREANKLPKQKWEHLVYVNDVNGTISSNLEAWIVTYKEGIDPVTVLAKLRESAVDQNESAKNKKSKLTTIGEVFSGIKNKFLKDKGIKVKTKESVQIIPVNGNLF